MKFAPVAFLATPLVALSVAFGLITPAAAHPHILATARSAIIYSADGKVTAVRQTWIYDPAYSAFAMREIDKNGDGKASDEELAAYAKVQVAALGEFGYFTTIKANDKTVEIGEPREYGFEQRGGVVLTLNFTLPLKAAIADANTLVIELFDPTFFAYFTLADDRDAVRLVGAPQGCATTFAGPKPIDLTHTRSIPAAFWAALDGSAEAGRQFVNRIVVTCP